MRPALTAILAAFITGCGAGRNATADDRADRTRPVMVYRTKHDVHDKVPVGLSDDRRHIVSYPHPKDLMADGGLRTPTALIQGYWLDNLGVGPNTGFIALTYSEYAALPEAPSITEMEAMLIDRDPWEALCDCGVMGTLQDPVKELNAWLKKRKLAERCKTLK